MAGLRRNSVYVALHGTIGRELVFRHYTNKVVAACFPDLSKAKPAGRQNPQMRKMRETNDYAQHVLRNPELKAIYEKHLGKNESAFQKAKQNPVRRAGK